MSLIKTQENIYFWSVLWIGSGLEGRGIVVRLPEKPRNFLCSKGSRPLQSPSPRRHELDTVGASRKSKAAGAWRWPLTCF